MSFLDILHLKSSNAVLVSSLKNYFERNICPFSPVNLESVTAQMPHVSELLINFVIHDKPNTLTGLNQKVCSRLTGSFVQLQGHQRYRKKGRT
jgi:hypothetical protein